MTACRTGAKYSLMRGLHAKTRVPAAPHEEDLSPRSWEVLRTIILSHVEDGAPVGSVAVSRELTESLSPATIRGVMAHLEEIGFLSRSHSSAGRVPTERAYSLYARTLLRSHRPHPAEERRIAEALGATPREVPALMEQASKILSRLSRNVGIVVGPDLSEIVLKGIEFLSLGGGRILAVIVGPNGAVVHRLVGISDEIPQEKLDRMARIVVEELAGMTLREARGHLLHLMTADIVRGDPTMGRALTVADQSLAGLGGAAASAVYMGGVANILEHADVLPGEAARDLFRAIEDREALIELIGECIRGSRVSIRIGSENEDPRLRHCAVLAAPYRAGNSTTGAVGIIGPTRMEYARAIALVETLSGALGRALGEARN